MTNIVSDVSGNREEKIANAAKVIGRSKDRLKFFIAVYTGKRKMKNVDEIASLSNLKNKIRVLQEGKKLASHDIVKLVRIGGRTAYEKYDFYMQTKNKIISLVRDKNKLKKFPTKSNPQFNLNQKNIRVSFPKSMIYTKKITIDNVDSFSKVRKPMEAKLQTRQLYESEFKEGIKKILGEEGSFVDWGGESNDLFSSRLIVNRKRLDVAFALKGIGTKGGLTPKMMGKNGDQIQRLFNGPADAFFVQYHGQIRESVLDLMEKLAIAKSISTKKRIYFGIIDGKDTSRLIAAYPKEFA